MDTSTTIPGQLRAEPPRRNSEKPLHNSSRKSTERRNSRSTRRKSGPKSYDVDSVRAEGRERRRRFSNSLRRTSKDNRASIRRLSIDRPPPSALPRIVKLGGATTPRVTAGAAVNGFGGGRFGDEGNIEEAGQETVEAAAAAGTAAAEAIRRLQARLDAEDSTWTMEMVAEAARGIMNGDRQLKLRCTKWLRMVLSLSETPPAAEVVHAGLVRMLVGFLRAEDFPEVLPEALCALTNIASTDYTKAVTAQADAVPAVTALMRHGDPYIREQSAWCLGNIAGDCVELRDLVLNAGAMEGLLLNLVNPSSQSVVKTGTWALANFCRGLPPPPLAIVTPVLSIVRPAISSTTGDVGVLIDSGWVLYHITRGGSDRIDAVLAAGLLTRLPDLLLHDEAEVVKPIIRTMDNMACSSGAHRGALIAAGVLDPLLEVLGHDSSKVRADALRLLSCIAAGSSDQVAAVASTADMIPSVMAELEEGNSACRREAAWVFLNMCQCGFEAHESLIPSFVDHGLIAAVCNNLDPDEEAESLIVMLVLLYTILEEGGDGGDGSRLEEYSVLVEESNGFGRTQQLMNEHEDMEVYEKGLDIVRSFMDENAFCSDEDGSNRSETNDHEGVEGSARQKTHDGNCSEMSDDSLLSDDSFHPEMGDDATMPMAATTTTTSTPISPLPAAISPQLMRNNIEQSSFPMTGAGGLCGVTSTRINDDTATTTSDNGVRQVIAGTAVPSHVGAKGADGMGICGDSSMASATGVRPMSEDNPSPAINPNDVEQTE